MWEERQGGDRRDYSSRATATRSHWLHSTATCRTAKYPARPTIGRRAWTRLHGRRTLQVTAVVPFLYDKQRLLSPQV